MTTPTCWNCGYNLTGIRVDDVCPECATPIWSRPAPIATSAESTKSMIWGIVSLCLFFMCLGPLAAFIAIPALVYAGRALQEVRTGQIPADIVSGARAGRICAWITIGLSIAIVAFYAIAFGLSALP
jgi:hypothetical protein